ncbi:MAG: ABC transporter substrate-binding protein [Gammaproteobacteria bacterium]|nr:ABC transporter substrate-binding protein [Gammaproteobacteria bacterium]
MAKEANKITLLVKDDEGIPAKAVEATRALIERDNVDALFGFVGDESVAAVAGDSVFKRARIALYAPLSGYVVSQLPDTIFYVRPTYRAEARYLINHFHLLGNNDFFSRRY